MSAFSIIVLCDRCFTSRPPPIHSAGSEFKSMKFIQSRSLSKLAPHFTHSQFDRFLAVADSPSAIFSNFGACHIQTVASPLAVKMEWPSGDHTSDWTKIG